MVALFQSKITNKPRTSMQLTRTQIFTRFSATILLLISSVVQATTEVKVSVDRNPVMINESFVLEIVANDSLDPSAFDLSQLSQTGLVIGRTATSSQTKIINGNIAKTTRWNVVLLARKTGSFKIPSLRIDSIYSKPLTVSVVESNTGAASNSKTIFVKNNIEQTNLYLQQTVKLVTKLYLAPSVDLQNGSLSDPTLEGAYIKQHGKDKDASEIIMGVRYRVIERIYSVTPQSSGTFTITSPAFNGEIGTGQRRSSFSNFGGTKPVTSVGNDIKIKVTSIPEKYSGPWLPSDLVMLNEEWQPEQDTYEIGEPITRTFTLLALNVNEEQLPEVVGNYPDSFKTYPDQSESHSEVRSNAIVSQRVSTEAIVATKVGTFELPAVTVNWFNTKTKRQDVATIPAKKITIVPSSNSQSSAPMTNLQMPILESSSLNDENCVASNSLDDSNGPTQDGNNSYSSPLMWAGWILWILTSLAWFIVNKRSGKSTDGMNKQTKLNTKLHKSNEQSTFNKSVLKQACMNNDAHLVRDELLKWAKAEFTQPVLTLTALIPLVNLELQQQIHFLNSSQYSQQSASWAGKELWNAFKLFNSSSNTTTSDDLPPLNG
jgi:hypothetical protein